MTCFCEVCIERLFFRDIQDKMIRLGYELILDPSGSGMMWKKIGSIMDATCQAWDETPEHFHRRAVRRAHLSSHTALARDW